MNRMFPPALVVAYGCFAMGAYLWAGTRSRTARVLVGMLALALAIPGVLFLLYFLHRFDHSAWYYELRALPGSELAGGGMGMGFGVASALGGAGFRRVIRPVLLAVLTALVFLPYIKPVIAPLRAGDFEDRWAGDVCLQSTSGSCGAASAATLLRAAGSHLNEREIARRSYTYAGGTENWYLARLLRREGFAVRFVTNHPAVAPLPVPSIAGVRVGSCGHFIPILAATPTSYITGDPCTGRQEWPKDEIRRHFDFTGFFMELRPPDPPRSSPCR